MGVSTVVQWAAWFAEYVIVMMVVLTIVTVCLCVPVTVEKVVNYATTNARWVERIHKSDRERGEIDRERERERERERKRERER